MSPHESSRPAEPPASPLRRLVHVVTVVEIGIAGLATAMIFVLILLQAAQRYLPIDGWTWTGELARYGLEDRDLDDDWNASRVGCLPGPFEAVGPHRPRGARRRQHG